RQVSVNRATLTQGNFCSRASSNMISAGESNELSMESLITFFCRSGHYFLRMRAVAFASRVLRLRPDRKPGYQTPVQPLQRLQVLAGFEPHGLSGRDIHFRTGSRVPADSRLPRLYREHAEAPQF